MKQLAWLLLLTASAFGQKNNGFYRFPAIHNDIVVFTAEGDLWTVPATGGMARRLTSHPGDETHAAISPDGGTVAFSANYEGPTEVYTMPIGGGLPVRKTFDGRATVVGWTPDGKILYSTNRFSTLPAEQLVAIAPDGTILPVPLSEAAQGVYDKSGRFLFFTRLPFQGSSSKRYQGGTAQNIWKYTGSGEATPLTGEWNGTSKDPMWWNGRVYFLSDRDGSMNLWSMDENGKDLKQLTKHTGFDAATPSLSNGRIVYRLAADLRRYDIASGKDQAIPVELASDFDNLREHWITAPLDYTTAAHVSPEGDRVVLTSRGRAFVAPVKQGRLVEIVGAKPGRFRDARFFGDGKSLAILSSESGEVEIWKAAANGIGLSQQLTTDGKVLRWEAIGSPDAKWIAHQDKDNQLWLLDTATKTQKRIATVDTSGNTNAQFDEVRWSPDSRWLLFDRESPNQLNQVMLYNVETGAQTPVTTDRYDNHGASWSADGKWIYLISDRSLKTVVSSPWGSRQPEPFFDKSYKIYAIPLRRGLRSPFAPPDELHPAEAVKPADTKADAVKQAERIEIDLTGIAGRIQEVPAPAGNYSDFAIAGNRLCWLDHTAGDPNAKQTLQCLDIANKGDKPETLMEDVAGFEVSANGKKIMIRKAKDIYVVDASAKAAGLKDAKTLADSSVNLGSWTFSVIPVDEFREEFADAWRLHRDYFYDRNMNGVNWKTMRDKYGELLGRVRDREELSEVIGEMVSELAALHTFVRGGDIRRGPDRINLSSFGARMTRDTKAGGYRIDHIYRSDPDRPDKAAPFARPDVEIAEGDIVLSVNGHSALSVPDPSELIRNQAGKEVLIEYKSPDKPETKSAIVKPISTQQDSDLRYSEWEYTRRLKVDDLSKGSVGYVHLRAMVSSDIDQWIENYIPVFNRDGLIIDVRHNGGGNIDSWILSRLMQKAWMYWQPRVGHPYWNMQEAFRGHMVVLCDEWTGSDGEAFTEGFRRLGLGKVIGTRTWGGEIWLSSSNTLADRGIASAAENGVFAPEGKWLIEGHGVDPDIVVDNAPHASYEGGDAQLDMAVSYLLKEIREKPVPGVKVPAYPDKTRKAR